MPHHPSPGSGEIRVTDQNLTGDLSSAGSPEHFINCMCLQQP